MSEFIDRLEKIEGSIHDLQTDMDKRKKEIKVLTETNTTQQSTIDKLERSINNMEQYSRRSCIRILGKEEKRGENTDTVVADICKSRLGIQIDISKDIDRSHRTGRINPPSSSSAAVPPRPIIVKLTSYRIRKEILLKRRLLKGTGVVIVEDLTAKNQKLLKKTREHRKVQQTWTTDGRIIALLPAQGGKTITKVITCEEDLSKL